MSKNPNIGGKFTVSAKSFLRYDNTKSILYLDNKDIYIKRVIYNNPATIVFWSDDTKTVAKCHEDDTYSEEMGLILCCLKKLAGSSEVRALLHNWLPDRSLFPEPVSLDLKAVRKGIKEDK